MTTTATTTTPSRKFVVLGGGIAGLSAAYELCKMGRGNDVLLLEKSASLGGNVRSALLPDTGLPLDFGALEIFGWYRNIHDYIDQLGLADAMRPVKQNFYVHRQRATDAADAAEPMGYERVDAWSKVFRCPEFAVFLGKLLQLGTLDIKYLSLYHPNPDRFGGMTIGEFLKDLPTLRRLLAVMIESYTYGSVDEIPLFLALPLISRAGSEATFHGNTGQVVRALAERIQQMGGTLVVNCEALDVERAEKHVRVRNTTDGTLSEVAYDELIVATPLGSLRLDGGRPFHCESTAAAAVPSGPDARPTFRYTHILSACVELDRMPTMNGDATWTAGFDAPDHAEPIQLLSFVNLASTLGWKNRALLYFTSHPEASAAGSASLGNFLKNTSRSLALQKVNAVVSRSDAFRSCRVVQVLHSEVFPHTMPVTNLQMYEQIQQMQGRDHVWFCGHYTGPYPSIETACYSGRSLAFRLADPDMSAAFEQWIKAADDEQSTAFQRRLVVAPLIQSATAAAAAAAAAAVVGMGGGMLWNWMQGHHQPPPPLHKRTAHDSAAVPATTHGCDDCTLDVGARGTATRPRVSTTTAVLKKIRAQQHARS